METIDIEAFKKAGLTYEEIESVKKGLNDIDNGKTVSYNEVKKLARKKIFSKNEVYV